MTISEQIRINRWRVMASADLGTDIDPLTPQFVTFFTRATESNQFDTSDCRDIMPIIRGFAINNPDLFSVVECLDLCYVSVLDELWSIDLFDEWLMDKQGWFGQYQYALKHTSTRFELEYN